MFILYIFSIFLSQPLSDLGHDSFEVRDKATQAMRDNFPASIPMLYFGLYSTDPEVKYRCNLVLREKKADSVILAKKMANSNIKKLLSMDEYPTKADWKFLEDFDQWIDFCDVIVHLKLHDPKKEIVSYDNREGIAWMMWARSKCVRYGKDPKVGSNRLPEIIRPGQEPKNKK